MKKFVFGVLTYNQENYILQTLESIKYQKIQYGKNIDVSLIITDDASKDKTVEIMKKWVVDNQQHFERIELIANEQNKGTVSNFKTILGKVTSESLKIIAGDDWIGSRNLFKEYESLTDNQLKTYCRVQLKDGKIYFKEKHLINFYYHKTHGKQKNYYLKNFRKGKLFHTPSTLYTKQLFTDAKCEYELDGYYLFEDDPMWYSMIKNKKDLEIEFAEQGIVLYRMHNQSVSNSPNPIFAKDMKRLREQYLKDAKGLEKIYLLVRMKTNGWPLYVNPGLYLDKIMNMKRERICKKDPGYQALKEKMEQQIKEEQKFYDAIMEEISKSSV